MEFLAEWIATLELTDLEHTMLVKILHAAINEDLKQLILYKRDIVEFYEQIKNY